MYIRLALVISLCFCIFYKIKEKAILKFPLQPPTKHNMSAQGVQQKGRKLSTNAPEKKGQHEDPGTLFLGIFSLYELI